MGERALAVVCVSGGMDSAVTAALAAREHRLAFLHANYGQRTEARELRCFHALADHFAAEARLVVDFSDLRQIGGSSLTDPALPVREGEPVEGVVPTSYVPVPQRAPAGGGRLLGRGARRARPLRGGRLGGLLGLPRLPAGVLPRLRGGDPARHAPGDGPARSSRR